MSTTTYRKLGEREKATCLCGKRAVWSEQLRSAKAISFFYYCQQHKHGMWHGRFVDETGFHKATE